MAITLDRFEAQMVDIMEKAKELKTQAQQLKKQGRIMTLQREVAARKSVHRLFEEGLSLLGKGLVQGRKLTETFFAETNRKAQSLQAEEGLETANEESAATTTAEPEFVKPAPVKARHPKSENFAAKSSIKKNKFKSRKPEVAMNSRAR